MSAAQTFPPVELRRVPPRATLAWVAAQVGPGARVVRTRRLKNSWAAAMHAVDVDDARGTRHRLVLRRWARLDLPPDIGVVENEAAVLTALASSALPVPRLVAFDATATTTDVPALLMTRVPGRDDLKAPRVDALATVLREIHRVPVPPGTLSVYRPWNLDTVTSPPPWSRHADVWRDAIAIVNEPIPAYKRVLVHRDFHPGNILWQHGHLTGVVDWTHSCVGPAAADVAHCRVNLAILNGLDAADAFADAYGPVDNLAWYDIVDIVGMGERPPDVWRWHDAGRTDLTVEKVIDRQDALLGAALKRL